MSVLKLKSLFNDIKFSMDFAAVHLNIGLAQKLRNQGRRLDSDVVRLRDTDADASRLAQFRHSINNNSTRDNDSGTDDYKQMVDILIRRGGLLDHYAGARDLKGWAELKDLAPSALKEKVSNDGWLKTMQYVSNNAGFLGLRSVAATAHAAAVSEVQASVGEELKSEIVQEILNEVVNQVNAGVEVNGEKISVADVRDYMASVTDGAGDRPQWDFGADGWN